MSGDEPVGRGRAVSTVHLVAGSVFTVLALAYLADDLGVVALRPAVLGPVLLVVAGLAVVAGAVTRARVGRR